VLPRQPLRFLSADDRGAGKTIKACLRNRERLNRRKAARWISRGCAQIRAIARWRGAALATRNIPDFEGAGAAVINPWNVP
jgi:predicted nucleic acid-binding protein